MNNRIRGYTTTIMDCRDSAGVNQAMRAIDEAVALATLTHARGDRSFVLPCSSAGTAWTGAMMQSSLFSPHAYNQRDAILDSQLDGIASYTHPGDTSDPRSRRPTFSSRKLHQHASDVDSQKIEPKTLSPTTLLMSQTASARRALGMRLPMVTSCKDGSIGSLPIFPISC